MSEPLLIDNHAHVGGLEAVDFVEGYDPASRSTWNILRAASMIRSLRPSEVRSKKASLGSRFF